MTALMCSVEPLSNYALEWSVRGWSERAAGAHCAARSTRTLDLPEPNRAGLTLYGIAV
jgi:hypothetical protein